tara:strand:- start:968 stop:1351 length:384 start_codon:yes stop_codon:yes gene_type:complete
MSKLNALIKLHSNDNVAANLTVNFIKENIIDVTDAAKSETRNITTSTNSIATSSENTSGFYFYGQNKSTAVTIRLNLETDGTSGATYAAIPPGEFVFLFIPDTIGIEVSTASNAAKLHFSLFQKQSS